MNSKTTTNVLLLIIAALLGKLVFPAWAPLIWLVLAGIALLWWLRWFKARREQTQTERARKAADAEEWNVYWSAHQAIRAKYDPEHKWNEASKTPREYREEIAELNELHSALLKRHFEEDL